MSELNQIAHIRNFGIIAHIDAGKTTVSERILFYTHKIFHMGEVHDGNSTMDFMPEEQERGITIAAASTFCEWKEHALNFIDTPGHVDFTIEVERSLRVLDGAVGVFCAVNGVEPQSETVWRQSEALAVPKLAFINKMDKSGADFEAVLDSMIEKLHANPILVQIPLFQEDTFYAVADLIRFVKLEFNEEDEGETILESALIDDEAVLAHMWREKMLESLADIDENFLDKYVGEVFTEEDIYLALRTICLNRKAVPTLVGAARRNKGIQPLLDAICHFLPSPLDARSSIENKKSFSDTTLPIECTASKIFNPQPLFSLQKNEFKALAFKIFPVFFDTKEKAVLIRLYNGTIKKGDAIFNLSQNNCANIENIYRLHADFYEDIEQAHLGEIVVITGLEAVKTGDTLLAIEAKSLMHEELQSKLLESIFEYKPVISLTFEAKNQEEVLILKNALTRYSLEDPTLILQNEDAGNFIVSGMGELHLEVLKERILREYKISPQTGNPHVVVCQSIQTEANSPILAQVIFEKEIDGVIQHADIEVSISSLPHFTHNIISFSEKYNKQLQEFSNKSSQNLHNLKDILQKSAEQCLESGSQNGYTLLGIHVEINSITIQEESTLKAVSIATHLAIKEAFNKAENENKCILLEPMMYIEITVPDENLSPCMNLLQSASANVSSFLEKGGLKSIVAHAPMRELFGFATRLRSVSQGRANLLMRFAHYEKI